VSKLAPVSYKSSTDWLQVLFVGDISSISFKSFKFLFSAVNVTVEARIIKLDLVKSL
jgi:hypothetical protein